MTNELEPLKECPFKKDGETHELEWEDIGYLKWVRCNTCLAQGPCDTSKQRAAELWNTRHKRTCKLIMHDGSPACSECLAELDYSAKFCDQCGKEVVDDH